MNPQQLPLCLEVKHGSEARNVTTDCRIADSNTPPIYVSWEKLVFGFAVPALLRLWPVRLATSRSTRRSAAPDACAYAGVNVERRLGFRSSGD